MDYSTIGFLAIFLQIIVNADILFLTRNDHLSRPEDRTYRFFIVSVIAYHLTDGLWGIIYGHAPNIFLYIDTEVYFAVMAISVFLWCRYALYYLGSNKRVKQAFKFVGAVLCAFQLCAVAANLFSPVLFSVADSGEYVTGPLRYSVLSFQMLMFSATGLYTLAIGLKENGSVRRRFLMLAFFGMAMTAAIAAQILNPLLPVYTIGYLVGCCLVHTFIMEDRRNEYLRELEESISREKQQEQELGTTRKLAYTDSLTGVKSDLAYAEFRDKVGDRIASGELEEFAVVVCDVNDLKYVNDHYGHETGDEHIRKACRLICHTFAHSPVFRIGGDEFVAFLEGSDYHDRFSLMSKFEEGSSSADGTESVSVAAGMVEFDGRRDSTYSDVFQLADKAMYARKKQMKSKSAPR